MKENAECAGSGWESHQAMPEPTEEERRLDTSILDYCVVYGRFPRVARAP